MNPEAFARTHAQTFPAGKAWAPADFQTYFDRDTTIIGGTAESYVLGTAIHDEAEILTVATAPDHQRQGKARAALDEFLNHAIVRKISKIFLEVASNNAAAIALYVQAGFAQTGLRQNYYRKPDGSREDAIVMQLNLPPR